MENNKLTDNNDDVRHEMQIIFMRKIFFWDVVKCSLHIMIIIIIRITHKVHTKDNKSKT